MSEAIRPVMLVVLDGWGWREEEADNAVRLARTPTFDRLWETCPYAFLRTSGLDVGLPRGQMGNSEVGHLNIGAGRVVMQDLPRIGEAIRDGSLATNPVLQQFIATLGASGGTCHLIGLVSDGGVHSHQDHAVALARIVAGAGIPVRMHLFTDGRDTPPQSAGGYVQALRAALPDGAKIGTVSGRYYAMDRDQRWERVQKAYCALAENQGPHFADAASAVDAAYANNVTDEFIIPACINGYRGMQDGDGILCFNFRADRVRQLLTALLDPGFAGFERARTIRFAAVVGMTPYSQALDHRMKALFLPIPMQNLLGQVVAAAGRTQIRMAETEKYPHVTYFFNGGDETPNQGEDRSLVPSPKVATYDMQPEMSAPELTDRAVAAIASGRYDLLVLNFANPDMVGHTGVLPAVITAVETVDTCLGRIVTAIEAQDGALLITADHGNCELMKNPETGGPHTAHTTFPVPAMLVGGHGAAIGDGRLADIAPTLLALMGIPQPPEMTGQSLLRKGD
ncbi:MAG: 2,3-bisphosphoglycerate-independent phosphoglycerate mutase [Acetobacteraceae bacterium]|nr:2,3-bisphosphoglycerate-independent phosphoglycerate mutase [Acetobacteraceae bacterium]